MKRLLAGLLIAVCPPAFAQTSAPEIPYDADANFFKLPKDVHFGEAAGVAVDSKKNVYVFHRGNVTGAAYKAQASQLLKFDRNGKYRLVAVSCG